MMPDGTEQKQDTLQPTADSSVAGKGTVAETPTTFTKEMMDKAVSDALSKAGREAKALSEQRQRLDAEKADLTAKQIAWQKKQEEAEEAAVADDMPKLTALREARRKKIDETAKATELTERESKLAQREAEIADIIERDKALTRTQLAAEVAVEKGVSVDAILKLAKEDTREAYVMVAELLPKTAPALPVLLSDSGKTNVGTGGTKNSRELIRGGFDALHPNG